MIARTTTSTPKRDFAAEDQEILSRLDIVAEYKALGARLVGEADSDGWVVAREMDREDRNPSAALNVETGRWVGHASGDRFSLYDFAAKFGPFADWQEAKRHFAEKAGVTLQRSAKKNRNQKADPAAKLQFIDWVETFANLYCRENPGITPEALRLAGARMAYYYDRYTVIALPIYGADLIDGGPVGWIVQDFMGGKLPRFDKSGKVVEWVKRKITYGSQPGVVGDAAARGLADPSTTVIYKMEGPSDMLAMQACLLAEPRPGTIAITTANGAGEDWRKHPWLIDRLKGRELRVIHDCDQPGQKGAEAILAAVSKVCTAKNYVLPYPVQENKGADFRDYRNNRESQGATQIIATLDAAFAKIEASQARTLESRNLTDLGNAERLVDLHGDNIRFCHAWGKWLIWDGRRWAVDETAAIARYAKETVRGIYGEAASAPTFEDRENIARFAMRSERATALAAMVSLAKSEPGIPISPKELDALPWLLNVQNGTLDLRTGTLKEHSREDRLTKLCPVDFDPEAGCPEFMQFLTVIFNADAELISFVQRLVGYSLTGNVQEHVLPVFYGEGANGKSTLTNALTAVLGPDYAMTAPADLLLARGSQAHPTELCDLQGKRLVVGSETESGRRFNESLVKSLTGGDAIRARRMREDFWEFLPSHTFFLATNHRPNVREMDHGIWRRIKLVPFLVTIPPERQDKQLTEKLHAEAAGILRWAVDGCLAWQKHGLVEPECVREATSQYQRDMDHVQHFLDERCCAGQGLEVRSSDLYKAYRQWCEDIGQRPHAASVFGKSLSQKKFAVTHKKNGNVREGLTLIENIADG